MKSFGITDKGKTRTSNQDTFLISELKQKKCLAAVLCDGMGGQNAGEVASSICASTYMETVVSKLSSRTNKNADTLSAMICACDEANDVAYEYSKFDSSLAGMGTTLVGAVIYDNGKVFIINVGDSRCYHISKDKIVRITTDHSLVEDLIRSGVITREEAKTHRQKSIITKAVGSEISVEPDTFTVSINKGDMILLCSDGLTNYVSEDSIHESYIHNKDPEAFCTDLLNQTYMNGAGDNVTIISVIY